MDAAIAAFLRRYWQSIESHPGPERFQAVHVDLRLEPPSEEDTVSDSPIHRLHLPALRDDLCFLLESSNLDAILDKSFPADVPLCMAPKPGLYDLSIYEVCSLFITTSPALTRRHTLASLPPFLRLHIIVESPKRMYNPLALQE